MIFSILKFLLHHPLNKICRSNALWRFLRWQISTRVLDVPVIIPFVNNSKLIAKRGFSVGSGNYYVGLLEFEEMSFLLHYLRKEDCFVDIGANIGAYTVLAAGVVGAECVSIEPIPSTFQYLLDNIYINRINSKVFPINIGLAETTGTLNFTQNFDSTNHVVMSTNSSKNDVIVNMSTLDTILLNKHIEMIKIDVEGFEGNVIDGGKNTFNSKNKPNVILIELRGHGKRYGINEEDIHNKLLNYGYTPFTYDPFNRTIDQWTRKNQHCLGDMLYISDTAKAISRLKTGESFCVLGVDI